MNFENFYITEGREAKNIGRIIHKIDFPSLRQFFSYSCGASSLQMIMEYYGKDVREEEVAKKVHTTENGTNIDKMVEYLEKNNLKVEHCENGTIDLLKEYIKKDVPVILPIQAWSEKKESGWQKKNNSGHFVVCIGVTSNGFLFSDPSCIMDSYLSNEELEKRWHDIDEKRKIVDHYFIAVKGKPKYNSQLIVNMG